MKIYSIDSNKEAVIETDETGKQNIVCDGVLLLKDVGSYSYEKLMASGFYKYESEQSEELCIKGEVVFDVDSVFLTYYPVEEFEKIRELRKNMLQSFYENKIDKLIRKATQDLAFGDITEIPEEIIEKREQYKVEYHVKVAEITAAKDVIELNSIHW